MAIPAKHDGKPAIQQKPSSREVTQDVLLGYTQTSHAGWSDA
jgi:hypothetical protein